MSIGAISGNASSLIQHLQSNSPLGQTASSGAAAAKASQAKALDSDHDGDTDTGGADTNDPKAPGQFINVKA